MGRAADLFVMRPTREMQQLLSVGRVVAVFVSSLAAVIFVRTEPSAAAVGAAAVAALAGAGGVRKSRWYGAPAFTTCLVLMLLLYPDATTAQQQQRFNERVGETLLGVAMACILGLAVPHALAWLKGRQTTCPYLLGRRVKRLRIGESRFSLCSEGAAGDRRSGLAAREEGQ